MTRVMSIVLLLLVSGGAVSAQDASHNHQSPYVDLQGREIKALSADEVRALLAGEGLGFALSAELNGFPGPKHVLELADSLHLTAEQKKRTEQIMAAMLEKARNLGGRIVEAERQLDRAFADGTITAAALQRTVIELGQLRGELRLTHLAAHLAVKPLLDQHQLRRYSVLRGYGAGHEHEDR